MAFHFLLAIEISQNSKQEKNGPKLLYENKKKVFAIEIQKY